jgi:DNA-binding response OmpR family regulator
MITAHGTREVTGLATQTGVRNIVLKPFTPSELVRGVAAAVARTDTTPDTP